jgi:hypothetical protein
LDEFLVNVMTQQAQGDVVTLGDEGGELQARDTEQKDVHGAAQVLPDGLLPEAKLTDVGLGTGGRLIADAQRLEKLQCRAVDAHGDGQQVVGFLLQALSLHPRSSIVPGDAHDSLLFPLGAALDSQLQEEVVEAGVAGALQVPRAAAAVDGRDPFFLQRGLNADASHIHVEEIGVNPSLHDRGRELDSLHSQGLDQRLRDYAPAHVAALGANLGEVAGLVDVHGEIEAYAPAHLQQEVAEEGACRPATDDTYAAAVVQRQRLSL